MTEGSRPLEASRTDAVLLTDETVIEDILPPSERKARRVPGSEPLLVVDGLRTSFHTSDGVVRAVDGISFSVDRGEIMGLVGESGCGKSVTSLSIMRLVARPGIIEAGRIMFDGRDLLTLSGDEMRKLRGDAISMIFQQPTSSLNPVWDVGTQISEVLELHRNMKGKAAHARSLELMRMVGIPDPERRLKAYPHELSGGMAQRVMIAMALACEPDLLIADEPTTALDVTIQAQILDLMRNLRAETGTAIILITHDLGVVAEMCDRVAVMYAGEVVEQTDVSTLFREPLHPYTRGLIGSIPVIGELRDELAVIPGNVPNLIDLPTGCRFAPRCTARIEHDVTLATEAHPQLRSIASGHDVRCWLYHDESGAMLPRPKLTPIREAAAAEVTAVLEADEAAADAAAALAAADAAVAAAAADAEAPSTSPEEPAGSADDSSGSGRPGR
ncbi:MAG TPA: ABC transporter ATP-binding protein [Candidatus Limnocylindrales bacterium]|nr:ABC transporter ATP-binding protein [Candidatus Limnocylindrales bacterium]